MINADVIRALDPNREVSAITKYNKTSELELDDYSISKWNKQAQSIYNGIHKKLQNAEAVRLEDDSIISPKEYDNFLKAISFYRSGEFVESYPNPNVKFLDDYDEEIKTEETKPKSEEKVKPQKTNNMVKEAEHQVTQPNIVDSPVEAAVNPNLMVAIKKEEPKVVDVDISNLVESNESQNTTSQSKPVKDIIKQVSKPVNTQQSDSVTETKLKTFKHLVQHAGANTDQFSLLSNGLISSNIVCPNGMVIPILLDLDGYTFGKFDKWYPTAFYPGFEMQFAPLSVTLEAITSIIGGVNQMDITNLWAVSPDLWVLNQSVDLTTLRFKDDKQAQAILERVYNAFKNEEFVNNIKENANGNAVRFSFAGVKNKDAFKLISGARNQLSFYGPHVNIDGKIVIKFNKDNAFINKKK